MDGILLASASAQAEGANFGYACLLLRSPAAATTVQAVEILARKLGLLLMSLGVIHIANLYLFHRHSPAAGHPHGDRALALFRKRGFERWWRPARRWPARCASA